MSSHLCHHLFAISSPSDCDFTATEGRHTVRGYRASDVATASRCHRPSITICSPFHLHLFATEGRHTVRGYRASDVATASRCHRPSITICSPSDHHFTATEGVTRCEGTEQATSQLLRGVIALLSPSLRHFITHLIRASDVATASRCHYTSPSDRQRGRGDSVRPSKRRRNCLAVPSPFHRHFIASIAV